MSGSITTGVIIFERGGMGRVYEGWDSELGRRIAIKVLPEGAAHASERLQRLKREARALAALNHPNIVTIYSVEDQDGTPFLTMELVEGQSLDRMIPQGGLPVGELFQIAESLTDAVAAAHERGLIHRDLKPSNVMRTGDGRIKVLDFGLAKFMDLEEADADQATATDVFTGDGVILGTLSYMSPEQVSAAPVDHRTDIFSLGIILYEMATGKRPFSGSSSAALLSSILGTTPANASEVRPDLPPGFDSGGRALPGESAP